MDHIWWARNRQIHVLDGLSNYFRPFNMENPVDLREKISVQDNYCHTSMSEKFKWKLFGDEY